MGTGKVHGKAKDRDSAGHRQALKTSAGWRGAIGQHGLAFPVREGAISMDWLSPRGKERSAWTGFPCEGRKGRK